MSTMGYALTTNCPIVAAQCLQGSEVLYFIYGDEHLVVETDLDFTCGLDVVKDTQYMCSLEQRVRIHTKLYFCKPGNTHHLGDVVCGVEGIVYQDKRGFLTLRRVKPERLDELVPIRYLHPDFAHGLV